MNVKAFIPLIAGLVVGVIALKLGADTLRKARGSQQKVATVPVYAAAHDIGRGEAVTETMLQELKFPEKLVPTGAFTDKAELVGRVAKVATFTGELFFDQALLPPGTRPGLPVPDGYRAVAVRIDEGSGVDYHIEPGSHVDVVAYFTIRGNGRQETIARTIIENVEVAAVGQRVSPNVASNPEEEQARGRQTRPARAVTLFVKPNQVPTLLLAEQRGEIKLSMRNGGDRLNPDDLRTITEDEVLGMQSEKKESLGDRVNALFQSWFGQSPSPATAAADPAPAVEEPVDDTPPPPVHKMLVFNGDDRLVLGWTAMNSMEPIELAEPDANPRGQRDGYWRPQARRAEASPPRSTPARVGELRPTRPAPARTPQRVADGAPPTDMEIVPEPEELE